MKGKTKGKDDFVQKKRILCKKMNKNSGILNIPEEFAGAVLEVINRLQKGRPFLC